MSGMDVLRERIAGAIHDHLPGASCDAYKCRCGERWTSQHVADAVIADLGLIPDVATLFPGADFCRYITPWERIEDDA